MTDHAHDMSLMTFFINGIAHGLAVYGQSLIFLAVRFLVPALKGKVQMYGIDADHDIANDGEAGDDVATLFATAVETLSRFLARLSAQSAMARYPRIPHRIAPVAMARTVGRECRRP